MCSAPKVPKAPKVKQVNPFQVYETDPEFKAKQKELGISNLDKDAEVVRIKQAIFQDKVNLEMRDADFVSARDALLNEGILERRYGKKGVELDPIHNDFTLQKVYDRMNELEQERYRKESDESFKQINLDFQDQFEKMQQGGQDQYEKMQKENQDLFAKMQKANMEAMRIPTQRQAPLAPVQAPEREFKQMPQAPVTPLVENLPQAPPPQLVDITPGQGGVIKQRVTARGSLQQGSRGAGALRIPRKSRSSAGARSIGLNIPTI